MAAALGNEWKNFAAVSCNGHINAFGLGFSPELLSAVVLQSLHAHAMAAWFAYSLLLVLSRGEQWNKCSWTAVGLNTDRQTESLKRFPVQRVEVPAVVKKKKKSASTVSK